jgi:lipopolysaccharide transport system permease protein
VGYKLGALKTVTSSGTKLGSSGNGQHASESRRRTRALTLAHYLDLILTLAQKEIKIRYKNSFFGYVWSLANPLASAVIFYLSIKIFLRVDTENYLVFLVVGLFAWQWFSNYLIGSCTTFIANASLIKKTAFPRFVLPIALNLQDAFHFTMALPVIVLFLVAYNVPMGTHTVAGGLLIVPAQFTLQLGIGLILACANTFFRDVERITAIALNMMFFLCPVVYPIDRVPEPYQILVWANPMTPIVEAWRGAFLYAEIRWPLLGLAYAYAAAFLGSGVWVYKRLSWRLAEAL